MGKGYSFKGYEKESMARAIGYSLPVSLKHCVEISNFIRHKEVRFAKNALGKVAGKKEALPFRKFNSDTGHKKSMASGRYPVKASREFLDLLNQVEANAQFKGLNTSSLVIKHVNSNKAATTMRFGRKRSRSAKRTHIEIVVSEMERKPSKKKEQSSKKAEGKESVQEVKPKASPAKPEAGGKKGEPASTTKEQRKQSTAKTQQSPAAKTPGSKKSGGKKTASKSMGEVSKQTTPAGKKEEGGGK